MYLCLFINVFIQADNIGLSSLEDILRYSKFVLGLWLGQLLGTQDIIISLTMPRTGTGRQKEDSQFYTENAED